MDARHTEIDNGHGHLPRRGGGRPRLRCPLPRNPDCRPHPLVIFSPGYLAPRFAYSALTEDLASRGYAVVSIDHTGEALVTIEPDGQMGGYSQSDPYSEQGLRTSIDTRVADAQFVIDEAEAIAKGERVGDADGRPSPTPAEHPQLGTRCKS